ncbi:MAG: MoaD/ThiS family protein [Verrucomicrobiales bacterium]
MRVLFFSLLRDVVGAEEIDWELPEGGLMVSAILEQLYQRYPGLEEWDAKILIALDLDYVGRDAIVIAGQELAVMPPVQGG